MNVLITGAAGFLGRNLTAKLLGEGHDASRLIQDLKTRGGLYVREFGRIANRYSCMDNWETRVFELSNYGLNAFARRSV